MFRTAACNLKIVLLGLQLFQIETFQVMFDSVKVACFLEKLSCEVFYKKGAMKDWLFYTKLILSNSSTAEYLWATNNAVSHIEK